MGRWNTVEAAHVPLGLVPEVPDAVDVVLLAREQLGVVDAVVLEAEYIQHVVGAERAGVNDRAGTTLVSMMAFSVLPFTLGMTLA